MLWALHIREVNQARVTESLWNIARINLVAVSHIKVTLLGGYNVPQWLKRSALLEPKTHPKMPLVK